MKNQVAPGWFMQERFKKKHQGVSLLSNLFPKEASWQLWASELRTFSPTAKPSLPGNAVSSFFKIGGSSWPFFRQTTLQLYSIPHTTKWRESPTSSYHCLFSSWVWGLSCRHVWCDDLKTSIKPSFCLFFCIFHEKCSLSPISLSQKQRSSNFGGCEATHFAFCCLLFQTDRKSVV